VPFDEDTRNCLLFAPRLPLRPGEIISLQMALHHAILATFQLEESELVSEPLPSPFAPRLLLFYEAAEGGAGVLRRLVEEPSALATVARTALGLCHLDDDGHDGGPEGGELCEAACYDCLLSYYNQPVHDSLDRHLAIPLLMTLAGSTVHAEFGGGTPEQQRQRLTELSTSKLEERWLEHIRERGYHLPEEAQPFLEQVPARPDFAYWARDAVVYVDGPWHDLPDRAARDAEHRSAVRSLGLRVIEFGHPDDWAQVFDTYRDVFGDGT
jgi:very-short-patch-repair endonuclease